MFYVVLLISIVAVQVSASSEEQPYKFGYSIKDKHGKQHREEISSGPGAVKGSYGFTDENGIHRQVEYVADQAGFRAHVKTNEPGTAKQNPAAVLMSSNHQVPSAPQVISTGFIGNAGPSKSINDAMFSQGFGVNQMSDLGGYRFPSHLNVGFGEIGGYNGGYGLGNFNPGLDDLPGVGLGYNGNNGNVNGYSGSNYQGINGMNVNNFRFGGWDKKAGSGAIRMNGLLRGSLGYDSDGKYNTALVGGNVRGFDSRYADLYKLIKL